MMNKAQIKLWMQQNLKWETSKWPVLITFFALGLTVLFELVNPGAQKKLDPTQVDTFIPLGYVLIPIEVQNYESLDSILGSYGIVDLYSVNAAGVRSKSAVVRGIKILRAPLNPNHFAVLSPEARAAQIVGAGSTFNVVVQNPKAVGTKFVDVPSQQRRLWIENGGHRAKPAY